MLCISQIYRGLVVCLVICSFLEQFCVDGNFPGGTPRKSDRSYCGKF